MTNDTDTTCASAGLPDPPTPSAVSAMSADADDFLARAQALGLRLTRADYERTRAGVTAFLRAERMPPGAGGASSAEGEEERVRERSVSPESDHGRASSAGTPAAPGLSHWLCTASGQLSFFTAVVRPMSAPNEEGRMRITLDDVGSAEERRRGRVRRRRMLEKQMLLEDEAARAEVQSPRTVRAASVASEVSTVEARTPLRHEDEGMRCSTPMAPPKSPVSPASPDIQVLNRMARMDPAGKLWLAPRDSDGAPKAEDPVAIADDSGVSFEHDVSDPSSLFGWGPRAFARTSATTEHLDACMKSMSLLDRIMLGKSSPRRIRREAKARARDQTDTTDEEAAADADESSSSHCADTSCESATNAALHSGGGARWPPPVTTPLRPPGGFARDQFDFVIQDIVPDAPSAASTSRTPAPNPARTAHRTPLTKLDPCTQITPMRYSPGYYMGYSHTRSTPIPAMFSPNILTPWTHHGRLMTNAGLANIPLSPGPTSEWAVHAGRPSEHAPDFPMSFTHLAFGDVGAYALSHGSARSGLSPERLLCIDSFPGKSPEQRTALSHGSPTKPLRANAGSPLSHRGRAARTGSTAGPSNCDSRLELVHRMAPLQSPATADKTPFRRTDTVRPTDLFHPCSAPRTPWLASDVSDDENRPTASSPRRASPMSETDASEAPGSRAPRPALPRRKNTMLRSVSAIATTTPTHSNDVFAQEAPKDAASLADVVSEPLSTHTEWDTPEGGRVIKLISDELQAAMDSGTLESEPEPRFFRLPPGYASSKAKPASVSYAGLIGQAILSSSDGRLSLAEIYLWISSVYPYYERGDRGWQNSIRHNLSLNKSFVKLERESSIPGKGGWWAIVPGHEARFQNGLYQPNVARTDAATARVFKPSHSAPAGVLRSPVHDERARKKRQGTLCLSPSPAINESASDAGNHSFKRPKTVARPLPAEMGSTPLREIRVQNSSSGAQTEREVPVLTDGPSSPATSPLHRFAMDSVHAGGRAWPLNAAYAYVPPMDRSSPSKAMPLRPMHPVVRPLPTAPSSLPAAVDYPMPMHLPTPPEAHPASLSPVPPSGVPGFSAGAYRTSSFLAPFSAPPDLAMPPWDPALEPQVRRGPQGASLPWGWSPAP